MARLMTAGFCGDLTTVGRCEFSATAGSPTRSTTTIRNGERFSMRISSLTTGARRGVGFRGAGATVDGRTYCYRGYLYVVTRPSAQNTVLALCSAAPTPSDIAI